MTSTSGRPASFDLFDGSLKPAVDRVYAVDDVVEAAEKMHGGEQFGNVVLAVALKGARRCGPAAA